MVLSNVTASQAVHEQYGGVVPELASRAHEQNIVPVVDAALKRAGLFLSGRAYNSLTLCFIFVNFIISACKWVE